MSSIDEYEAVRADLVDKQAVLDAKQTKLTQTEATLEAMRERAETEIENAHRAREEAPQGRGGRPGAGRQGGRGTQARRRRSRPEGGGRRRGGRSRRGGRQDGVVAQRRGRFVGCSGSSGAVEDRAARGVVGPVGPSAGGGTTDDEGGGGGAVGGCGSNCAYVDTEHRLPGRRRRRRSVTPGVPPAPAADVTRVSTCSAPAVRRSSPWCPERLDQRQNALGGNAIWLIGDNGNKYYYAHLDGYEQARLGHAG